MNKPLIYFGLICQVVALLLIVFIATAKAQPAAENQTNNQTNVLLSKILHEEQLRNQLSQMNAEVIVQNLMKILDQQQKILVQMKTPPQLPIPPFSNSTSCKQSIINGTSVMVCPFPPVPNLQPIIPPTSSDCFRGFC